MGNLNFCFNFLFFNQKHSDRNIYEKVSKIVIYCIYCDFLVPLASYADGRVRFNYRVAGSDSNPELGPKTVSSYTKGVGYRF